MVYELDLMRKHYLTIKAICDLVSDIGIHTQ